MNKEDYYYCWNRNLSDRRYSSSGGAFRAIAESFVERYPDALVIGAVYEEPGKVSHHSTDEGYTIQDMCGSKYPQSSMGDMFKMVIEAKKNGREILFSGTPCQIAGLNNVCKNYEKLYTVDIVCHGVINPDLFEKYISSLCDKKHGRVISYSFRNKKGKSYRLIKIVYEDGYVKYTDTDYFCMAYKYKYFYRKSCNNCVFSSPTRMADITLGDFWGIEDRVKSLKTERKNGISMLLVNSEKGNELLDISQNRLAAKRYKPDVSMVKRIFVPTHISKPKFSYDASTDIDASQFFKSVFSTQDIILYVFSYEINAMRKIKRRFLK